MEMKHCIVFFVVLFCGQAYGQGLNCNGKSFICRSATTFQACAEIGGGVFITLDSTINSCPNTTFCSNNDALECTSQTIPPSLTTTRRPTTTRRIPTTLQPSNPLPSQCASVGRIPNPRVPYCAGFIICINNNTISVQNQIAPLPVSCPALSVFDPFKRCCSQSYQCTGASACSAVGRYINPTDNTARTFYLCVRNRIGGFSRSLYSCPRGCVFNNQRRYCVRSSLAIPAPLPPVIPRPGPVIACPRTPFNQIAIPDPSFPGCRRYIVCMRRGNGYITQSYSCLNNFVFHPFLGRCVLRIFYRCRN